MGGKGSTASSAALKQATGLTPNALQRLAGGSGDARSPNQRRPSFSSSHSPATARDRKQAVDRCASRSPPACAHGHNANAAIVVRHVFGCSVAALDRIVAAAVASAQRYAVPFHCAWHYCATALALWRVIPFVACFTGDADGTCLLLCCYAAYAVVVAAGLAVARATPHHASSCLALGPRH